MNRRMIAAALACLACTAGLSACSLTDTGDTHHIAVIIKHAGEHFQNVMAGAEACASEHPNVTIDIQFSSTLTLMPRLSRRRFIVIMLPRSPYRLRMSG